MTVKTDHTDVKFRDIHTDEVQYFQVEVNVHFNDVTKEMDGVDLVSIISEQEVDFIESLSVSAIEEIEAEYMMQEGYSNEATTYRR